MSSIRVQKIFDALQESLRRMGYDTLSKDGLATKVVWQGRGSVTNKDSVVIDVTSASWATAHLRAILVAVPAGDGQPAAAFTQSHASGEIIQGGVRFQMWMETPANFTGAHKIFMDKLMLILVGQMGAPVDVYLSANSVEPTVNGVNAAVADVGTFAASYLPWGMATVGGI